MRCGYFHFDIAACGVAAEINILYDIMTIEIGSPWAKITYLKSHAMAHSDWKDRYWLDLSNKIITNYFCQEAANISEVKVGGQLKYLLVQTGLGESVSNQAELADIFFQLQLWPLIFLQPLEQNQCLVPSMKDLICTRCAICFCHFSSLKYYKISKHIWCTFRRP